MCVTQYKAGALSDLTALNSRAIAIEYSVETLFTCAPTTGSEEDSARHVDE